MKTDFQRVLEFNKAFGLKNDPNEIFEDKSLLNLKLGLIEEEVEELKKAVADKDRVEVADALADILYVVHGAGIAFGINLDDAFSRVHESNMSKLCDTEEEAIETVEWYEKEFRERRLSYDSPTYRQDPTTGKFVVFNRSTGKVLKNKYYKKVDLEQGIWL